ncbi:uncharacterized protein LOC110032181 isoform X2 [Phalaenopsis equestris]|uniref:uncharacterized protein LOC110032181 isoform X2 n=1 Tax=Phalaenopsis equestris TaxID=78828 RepID=UPI0009E3497A|nr:uncharacterized protein LOC110032181 isoform X2 [Phalaenopsis equestris]
MSYFTLSLLPYAFPTPYSLRPGLPYSLDSSLLFLASSPRRSSVPPSPSGLDVFCSSKSAMEFTRRNKYFNLISKGVERDGWKFVLLARFSPVPSYVINYALAATKVRFFVDFLLPTVIGCLPMILQNTSIGSLASAAVASTTGSKKNQLFSYIFPLIGIGSSVLISFRIKKYSSGILASTEFESSNSCENNGCDEKVADSSSKTSGERKRMD